MESPDEPASRLSGRAGAPSTARRTRQGTTDAPYRPTTGRRHKVGQAIKFCRRSAGWRAVEMPQPVHSRKPPQDAAGMPSQAPRGSWGRGPTATPRGPSVWTHGRFAGHTCSARRTGCRKPCPSRRPCQHRAILAWPSHGRRLLQRQRLAPSTSRWTNHRPDPRRARGRRMRQSPTARTAAGRSVHEPPSAQVRVSSLHLWQYRHDHTPNAWCAGEPCEEVCGDEHGRTRGTLLMESVLGKWFREF